MVYELIEGAPAICGLAAQSGAVTIDGTIDLHARAAPVEASRDS